MIEPVTIPGWRTDFRTYRNEPHDAPTINTHGLLWEALDECRCPDNYGLSIGYDVNGDPVVWVWWARASRGQPTHWAPFSVKEPSAGDACSTFAERGAVEAALLPGIEAALSTIRGLVRPGLTRRHVDGWRIYEAVLAQAVRIEKRERFNPASKPPLDPAKPEAAELPKRHRSQCEGRDCPLGSSNGPCLTCGWHRVYGFGAIPGVDSGAAER